MATAPNAKRLLVDYLYLQAVLVARLEQVLNAEGQLKFEVIPIEDLRQMTEANVRDNLIYVMWDRDIFGTSETQRAGTASQSITQVWTGWLAKRSAQQQVRDARNVQAGPLLSTIHMALAGWTPEGAHRPFRRINGQRANYRANVGLYPLTFSIDLNL